MDNIENKIIENKITEDTIKIGDIYKLSGPYNCTIKISFISRFVYLTGAIAPYIEGIDKYFETCNKQPYPIFYGKTDDDFIRNIWFTFRDNKTDNLLGDNIIAIFPDDEDYSFRVWCENEGIHKISKI